MRIAFIIFAAAIAVFTAHVFGQGVARYIDVTRIVVVPSQQ